MWILTSLHVTSIPSSSVLTIRALVRHTNPTQQNTKGSVFMMYSSDPVKILPRIQIGRCETQVFEIDFRRWEFGIYLNGGSEDNKNFPNRLQTGVGGKVLSKCNYTRLGEKELSPLFVPPHLTLLAYFSLLALFIPDLLLCPHHYAGPANLEARPRRRPGRPERVNSTATGGDSDPEKETEVTSHLEIPFPNSRRPPTGTQGWAT